jgi:hypothetical protein
MIRWPGWPATRRLAGPERLVASLRALTLAVSQAQPRRKA